MQYWCAQTTANWMQYMFVQTSAKSKPTGYCLCMHMHSCGTLCALPVICTRDIRASLVNGMLCWLIVQLQLERANRDIGTSMM